jgi:serine/threonine-protein kinase ATR
MATFQTMVGIPELSEVTLESWYKFLTTLGHGELGAHVGPTSAAIVASWKNFSAHARNTAYQALEYIVTTGDAKLREYLRDVVDLSVIDQLRPLSELLKRIRSSQSPKEELQRILEQSASDNSTVVIQALQELKSFLLLNGNSKYIQEITSGDMFDPMVGQILASLLSAACRDNNYNGELLRQLSFECIGVLGAMDPDRYEIPSPPANIVILKNFTDEEETVIFALHLIQHLLVGAFRATSDIKYQTSLAYSIQELLAFCRFTPAVVATRGTSVSMKTRKLWNSLPKQVLETVTPLLAARYTVSERPSQDLRLPIYPQQSTYREWIQLWAIHLISRTSGPMSQRLFNVFRSAVRSRDVVVAHHLLPHLVLHVLISGNDGDADGVRTEMISVLEDQVDSQSRSTSDKKLLSAQVGDLAS